MSDEDLNVLIEKAADKRSDARMASEEERQARERNRAAQEAYEAAELALNTAVRERINEKDPL